jgi:hypothetical protein
MMHSARQVDRPVAVAWHPARTPSAGSTELEPAC